SEDSDKDWWPTTVANPRGVEGGRGSKERSADADSWVAGVLAAGGFGFLRGDGTGNRLVFEDVLLSVRESERKCVTVSICCVDNGTSSVGTGSGGSGCFFFVGADCGRRRASSFRGVARLDVPRASIAR